jgi:hypothetical protein
MLQAIVQSHEALSNFLSLFRDAFGIGRSTVIFRRTCWA